MLKPKHIAAIVPKLHKAAKHTPHCEHYLAVCYSFVDAMESHGMIMFIGYGLFIVGAVIIIAQFIFKDI